MLPQSPYFCYGVGCLVRILTPVQRLLAVFVAAAFSVAVQAADKPAKARVHKAAAVEVTEDGAPLLKSMTCWTMYSLGSPANGAFSGRPWPPGVWQ